MEANKNPDILNCLANLSSDEVFTSPELVNKMLDMLPTSLFQTKTTKFLDPCSKSGVFLREIAKRLIVGLEKEIPDLQERVNWIMKNQLFGIPLTELTYQMTKRSLYCSISAAGKYSIATNFSSADSSGNICAKIGKHEFDSLGKCKYCGIGKEMFQNSKEQYAYYFIHTRKPKEIFSMKFDVIIGNPPYQLKVSQNEEQQNAISLYNHFIETAKKLNPTYLSMIIPSRWMTGGRGLDTFRESMLKDDSIKVMHDYLDASECFPNVEIKGGVCYFLRDSHYHGECDYYLHRNGHVYSSKRRMNDLSIGLFVRDNRAISIIKKVKGASDFKSFEAIAGSQTPYGIVTSFSDYKEKPEGDYTMRIYGNKFVGFTSLKYVKKNLELAYKYKVLAPKAVGDGLIETDKINAFVPENPSICTQTYIIYGAYDNKTEADNLCAFMKTKFFHFLLGQLKNTQQMSPSMFKLVPLLDFKKSWCDKELYSKYKLTPEEIEYIDSSVWPEKDK